MSAEDTLSIILGRLRGAPDQLEVARTIVLEQGGQWIDAAGKLGVFEIQLAGLAGIGPSPLTAIEDWMVQARETLGRSERASI